MNESNQLLAAAPVPKAFFKLAIPAVAAPLINILYNLVDKMFIGHIPTVGKQALAGVGVTTPVILAISAFAALVSMGGAPKAIFLTIWRKIILLIPLIFLLPHLWSDVVTGVYLAEPIADTIAVCTTAPMFYVTFGESAGMGGPGGGQRPDDGDREPPEMGDGTELPERPEQPE